MIRLYAALGLLAAIAGAWMRYDYIANDRLAVKQKLSQVEISLKTERKNSEKIAALSADYFKKLNEEKAENEKREKCISDGSCVVTVRVRVPATCPAAAAQDAAGTQAAEAELDASARRAYYNLRGTAIELQAMYDHLYKYALMCESSGNTRPDQ